MKIRFFTILFLMVAFAFSTYATNPISPTAVDFEKTTVMDKKANKAMKILQKFAKTKVGKWVAKKAVKVMKYFNAIDLEDPVQKWLWYAIFALVGAVILSVLGVFFSPIWYVSYLVWLAGVVMFWYWVYLKFLK